MTHTISNTNKMKEYAPKMQFESFENAPKLEFDTWSEISVKNRAHQKCDCEVNQTRVTSSYRTKKRPPGIIRPNVFNVIHRLCQLRRSFTTISWRKKEEGLVCAHVFTTALKWIPPYWESKLEIDRQILVWEPRVLVPRVLVMALKYACSGSLFNLHLLFTATSGHEVSWCWIIIYFLRQGKERLKW